MTLSKIQYRDIMQEYEMIRQKNYRISQQRLEEIYSRIPEIQKIDDSIASESLAAAKRMLFHPEIDHKSILHEKVASLIQEKKELLAQYRYPLDYLDPVYDCASCQDTGYIINTNEKCACFKKRIQKILFEQSNLLNRMDEQNFDNLRIDYYSTMIPEGKNLSPRENMCQILDKIFPFIRNFGEGENLLIYGNSGVGKTFLTTCIAGEIIRSGHSVIYMTAQQLFEQLADYTFRREEQSEPILPMIIDTDLLIIDDLGTEMNNAFVNSQLFHCINERILRKKSTIISTNFSLKQINQVYTERISSRLIEFYTLLNIYGDDIRIKKTFSPID